MSGMFTVRGMHRIGGIAIDNVGSLTHTGLLTRRARPIKVLPEVSVFGVLISTDTALLCRRSTGLAVTRIVAIVVRVVFIRGRRVGSRLGHGRERFGSLRRRVRDDSSGRNVFDLVELLFWIRLCVLKC